MRCKSICFVKIFREIKLCRPIFFDHFVVRVMPSTEMSLGIITSKKNGNAVVRNRIKRRIRHAFMCATYQNSKVKTQRVLIITKKSTLTANFSTIVKNLMYAISK